MARIIQQMLSLSKSFKCSETPGKIISLKVDGIIGNKTISRIEHFQKDIVNMAQVLKLFLKVPATEIFQYFSVW